MITISGLPYDQSIKPKKKDMDDSYLIIDDFMDDNFVIQSKKATSPINANAK